MSGYNWIPRGREIEERVLVGGCFLVIFFLGWCVVEIFKWIVSLF